CRGCGNATAPRPAPVPGRASGEASPCRSCEGAPSPRSLPSLSARLRINVALNRLLAHIARRAGEVAARPGGRELKQVWELLAEMEGCDALALLHHLGGAVARPHPHKQVDVVRLNS